MKKVIFLFTIISCVLLIGCGGGGGGNPVDPVIPENKIMENYPSIKVKYDAMLNSLDSAISHRNDDSAVQTQVANLMLTFSDDFLQSGVNKEELKDKFIRNIKDTSTELITYRVNPVVDTSIVKDEKGYKLNNDGTLSIATQIYIKVKKGNLTIEKDPAPAFNITWKNEGTSESPDWKIISGFPVNRSDLGFDYNF